MQILFAMGFLARPRRGARVLCATKTVTLRRGKARLFREGNPMVFGGAVERTTGNPGMGEAVEVLDGAGNTIGWGVYNEQSMFRVRLLEVTDEACLDVEKTARQLLHRAIRLRRALDLPNDATDAFRLVNAEGDGLSGLVVDVFGSVVVCSVSAAWVQLRRDMFTRLLREALGDVRVVWRPVTNRLRQDGLDVETDDVEATVGTVTEHGIAYEVDATTGQKTGFYCDQRDNRALVASLANNKTLLDLFCYSGGFSLAAARSGATRCVGVDSSQAAVDLAARNAKRNGLQSVAIFEKADVLNWLKDDRGDFDIVVCDPPKLAPSVKDLPRATRKYRALNALAMNCVKEGGLLLSCTCSSAMTTSGNFLSVLDDAATDAGRQITLLKTAGPALDHTLHPAMVDVSSYLTAVLLRID